MQTNETHPCDTYCQPTNQLTIRLQADTCDATIRWLLCIVLGGRCLMQAPEQYLNEDWWAEGDTPVREHNSRVTYLVDGRTVMLTMCLHFLRAHEYIYIAGWGMTPLMELVRGTDHQAGPDGSPPQEALLADLRAQGLSEADIEFWKTHDLSVQAVLGYAVSKGVEVKVL